MSTGLRAEGAAERVAAMAALLDAGRAPTPDEVAALTDALADERKQVQRRAAETCAALAGRDPAVITCLEAALSAPDWRRRWGAAYALARLGPVPRAARPTLVEMLANDDGDLRWAAADLLKRLAAEEYDAVVADLLTVARIAGGGRKMALYCLRDLGVIEAAEVALTALDDPSIDARLAALAVIAALASDRHAAAELVAALVDDADVRMRRTAAATLGTIGEAPPVVIDALARAAASDDASLRRAAAGALAKLGR